MDESPYISLRHKQNQAAVSFFLLYLERTGDKSVCPFFYNLDGRTNYQ
jgi:hypothetical protein